MQEIRLLIMACGLIFLMIIDGHAINYQASTDAEIYAILSIDAEDGTLEYPCAENVPDYSGWCGSTTQSNQYMQYGILRVYEGEYSYEVHCTGPRKNIHQAHKEDILRVCSQDVNEVDVFKEQLEDEFGQRVDYMLLPSSIIVTLEDYGTLEVEYIDPPMFITVEYLSELIWAEIE